MSADMRKNQARALFDLCSRREKNMGAETLAQLTFDTQRQQIKSA